MIVSTSFKCSAIRAARRPHESGTARGRREPLGPPSASSTPPAGRSPRTWRGRPAPLPDRVRLFVRERENVAQEGFDAMVHRVCPPYRLGDGRHCGLGDALTPALPGDRLGVRPLSSAAQSYGRPRAKASRGKQKLPHPIDALDGRHAVEIAPKHLATAPPPPT
jgi:hypothetical protein